MSDRLFSAIGAFAIVALVGFIAFIVYDVHKGSPAKANPPQQTTGHISDNDLRNGITAVLVTVHGRQVPCVYAAAPGSSGGWAGGVSITCDWGKR